jgi:hypothetical protein
VVSSYAIADSTETYLHSYHRLQEAYDISELRVDKFGEDYDFCSISVGHTILQDLIARKEERGDGSGDHGASRRDLSNENEK